jgi:light-regulated signal transduction histidine kinase (bacteriophytochrome)|tara:strand:+ start:359 stop:1411 length:1053 start_codon:yes stop_codon:yes gene_type:complete
MAIESGSPRSNSGLFVVIVSGFAVIFAVDLSLPLGVAGGVPYVAIVLMGAWLRSRRYILALAGVGTVLTVIGFLFSPSGGIPWMVLTNRGLALLVIWAAAILLLKYAQAAEDIRRLNAELEQRVVELDAVNQELEAFAYSVSHDLRGPLRSMDGFSYALLEDYGDQLDAEGKDYLQRVRAGSQRMAQLIDDLLKLSRVTRGELERRTIDLSEMAQTVAAELRESAPEHRVSLDIAPGVTAEGDARMIRIVFENLLGNAWKFTGKNPRAKIEFGVTNHDGAPAYFVRDDGAGFDMAYAGNLFQPFQRLHSGAEFGGTGIGLATVARVIHRHGGNVWAESAVEHGTTIYFTI